MGMRSRARSPRVLCGRWWLYSSRQVSMTLRMWLRLANCVPVRHEPFDLERASETVLDRY
jgi:hypothetical protein